MANQYAIQDPNRFPAQIIHSGTAGTAETIRRTGQAGGAADVHVTGGTVTTTMGDLTGGTIDLLTDGTVQVKGGTVTTTMGDLTGGTIDELTTGSIANIAFIHEIGTMPSVGGGTQFAEDTAHVSGAGGNLMLGVGNEAGSAFAVVGDYIPFALTTSGKQYIATVTTVDAVTTVSNLTNGSVRMTVGTLTTGSLANVAMVHAGTIDVLDRAARDLGKVDIAAFDVDLPGGTVDLITAVGVGTAVGADAAAGTSNTRPIQIGGTTSTGTVYGMLVDTAGNPQVDVVNTPNVAVTSLVDLPGGTLDLGTIAGNVGVSTGTITTGSIANIGVVHNAGTIAALPDLPGGTVDLITAVTTVNNLTNGSVRMTVGTLTTGSITNLAMLHAGTIDTVTNLNDGTVHIDSLPVRTGTSYGTLGTTGAAVWGTLIAGAGAGTRAYVTGLAISIESGTVDCAITNVGTIATIGGAGVLARGKYVPGGGIVRDFTNAQASGTGGTLAYYMGGAGTVSFIVNYYHV